MGFIYLSEQNSYSGKNSAGSSDAPILEWVKKKPVDSRSFLWYYLVLKISC